MNRHDKSVGQRRTEFFGTLIQKGVTIVKFVGNVGDL